MGEVIRKTAAVDDIIADLRKSYTAAQARGAPFRTLAEQVLKPALALCELVDGKFLTAQAALGPLLAEQQSEDDRVDGIIGRIADSVWNDIGRPAGDPLYDLLFPGGITFYTDGPDEDQPARMELLADLLESGLHPRLEAQAAKAYSDQIRSAAHDLEASVDAARKPRAQTEMYSRMRGTAARNGQVALVNFKRMLKAAGLTEADIHSVIPDRPSPVPAKKSPRPAPLPA